MLFDHNNYDYQKFIGTIDKTLVQKISFVHNTFIASGITIVSQFILPSTMIRMDDLIHSCVCRYVYVYTYMYVKLYDWNYFHCRIKIIDRSEMKFGEFWLNMFRTKYFTRCISGINFI